MALIMVVEDDSAINALMALTLRVEDYEVIQARDGAQALKMLETHKPDLILLDVMMPHMSGYEVATKLQDNPSTARIPIIFVTAKSQMEDRVRGLDLAVDYVCKPFAAPELLARVRAAIRIQRLQEELRVSNEQLKHLANTDALTDLYNRRHFDTELADEVSRAQRYNHAIALVHFDLDRFKSVNDNWGHEQGDLVLRAFSEVLRRSSRRIDTIARTGGEEFVAILPETDEAGAFSFAEKVRLTTSDLQFPVPDAVSGATIDSTLIDGEEEKAQQDIQAKSTQTTDLSAVTSTHGDETILQTMKITVSAGAAILPVREAHAAAWQQPEAALLQCADKLLYAAKNAGRNCVFTHTLTDEEIRTLAQTRPSTPLNDGS